MNERVAELRGGTVEAVALTEDNVGEFVRGAPLRVRAALRALVGLEFGGLLVRMPDGRAIRAAGRKPGPQAEIALRNWRIVDKAGTGSTIGVAESYMDGDWDSPDLTAFLELFTVNMDAGNELAGAPNMLANVVERLRHWLRSNTRRRARKNIAAHYDLGNNFYQTWLDATMTYSSALFSTGANNLETAQTAKYRRLAAQAGIERHHHVLEIGCGWGGFSEFLAREIGCKVTALTISREQMDFARSRIRSAGLDHLVEIRFQDYREEKGLYDRIVSVEMFEAVGEQYWPTFFATLRDCLKAGGQAGLQIISITENSYQAYRKRPDFIQRYIFPGGMLPTLPILEKLGRDAGLSLVSNFPFRLDYARTLSAWRDRFQAAWDAISLLGFDERFRRMWTFYLHYCEAGFRAGNTDVHQLVFIKD